MASLIDTGFLLAVLDRSDAHHQRAVSYLESMDDTEELVLPTPALVELSYMISSRLGHAEMRRFVGAVENGPYRMEPITRKDIPRVRQILDTYSDAELDFVDAFVTALAERLNIAKILTVDQRDFRMIRPRHCEYFEIVP